MSADGDNENMMQSISNRNWEEMRQQTLDALKVVQSFEAKPARSAHVQELVAQKLQARQFSDTERGNASFQRAATASVKPIDLEQSSRQALQPVLETSSSEKRFVGSPKKVLSASSSPAHSPLRTKNDRVREASPAKDQYPKRIKQMTPNQVEQSQALEEQSARTSAQPNNRFARQTQPQARSSNHQELTFSRASAALPQANKFSTRTGSGASSFRSVSRLLQPTAASAAKMRPIRAPMITTKSSKGPQAYARTDNSLNARPTTTASTTRPSAFVRSLSSLSAASNSAALSSVTKTNLPLLGPKRPIRVTSTQVDRNNNKTLSQPRSKAPAMPVALQSKVTSKEDTKVLQAEAIAAGPRLQPEPQQQQAPTHVQPQKSLLSSVLTKTHNGKLPPKQALFSQKSILMTPIASKASTQEGRKEFLHGPAEAPAVTSTPVRPEPNTSVGEHSSGSFQSFDFTNFSFEAEWARTPELRQKVLQQQDEDVVQLFGKMPPINLESIFGAEMKRQGR